MLGRLTEGIKNLPGQSRTFDAPLTTRTMKLTRPQVMIFHAFKNRQHIIPAPARIALGSPAIVISTLTTHVNHAVNRGAATEHAATRITQLAAIESGIGFSPVTPVSARITNAVEITDRNVYPVIIVWPTRLKQQDAMFRIR